MIGKYNPKGNVTKKKKTLPHSFNATHVPFRGYHAGDIQGGSNKTAHACPTEVEEWIYWDGEKLNYASENILLKCSSGPGKLV